LRVTFLTNGLPAPGDPIGDLIRSLSGVDVVAALTDGVPPGAAEMTFGSGRAVAVADAGACDIAVATSWETTAHLFGVPASRYAFWVDHLAFRRLGTWQAERFAAQLAYDLPVDFIATGQWLANELAELRPDARTVVVPRAVAITPPAPQAAGTALRVVVDDRHAPNPPGSDERAAATEAGIDYVILEKDDDAAARAQKLAGADVVLMLSPIDGALDGPLEGFHAGATAIVASAADADFVEHDVNGLVADPGDVRGTARWLTTLAQDRARLDRLKEGARTTAAGWPTAEHAAKQLETALAQLVAEEPPPTQWPVRLMGDAIGGATVFRQEIAALTAEVNRLRSQPAQPSVRAQLGRVKRRLKR
jgi:hypothetical protein